jgi:hypothetical protein
MQELISSMLGSKHCPVWTLAILAPQCWKPDAGYLCSLMLSAGSQTLVKLLQRRKPDAVKNPNNQSPTPYTGKVA